MMMTHRHLTIGLLTLWLGFPASGLTATLHALLVGDTNDQSIGRSVETDLANFNKLLRSIEENTGLAVQKITVTGGELGRGKGRDTVLQKLQSLTVAGGQDLVIFFYSGHGGRMSTKQTKWPSLGVEGVATSPDRLLDLDVVFDELQKKNPRLLIVIADACNSVIDAQRSFEKNTEQVESYRKLFLGYQGTIIASSSKIGQYSWGNPEFGGLFTRQFLDGLNKHLASSNPTWENLMKDATQTISIPMPGAKQQVQIPQAEVKVEPAKVPTTHDNPPPQPPQHESSPIQSEPTGTCQTGHYYQKGGMECCKDEGNGKELCSK
jgi:hypothetical protein